MDYFEVEKGQAVLVLWCSNSHPEKVKEAVEDISSKTGNDGKVQVENADRLLFSKHENSRFDVCMSGVVEPISSVHSQELLTELLRVLKPNGWIYLNEVVIKQENGGTYRTKEKLQSVLKLSGFINISETKELGITTETKEELYKSQDVTIVNVKAQKPGYEVGASVQLSFLKKPSTVDEKAAAVWSLSASDVLDDDVDIIDSDQLLDEDDLKKPDPASLRVDCSNGPKKKKACKNCTCGLADEIEEKDDNKRKQNTATSACGNCYLGDAFRCSSCPYLGMPAFKPGEKVQLSDRQLNPDL